MWEILEFGYHPRAVLTHLILGALLRDLIKQGVSRKVCLTLGFVEEIIGLVLWIAIPNGFATIIVLYLSIKIYESLVGPRFIFKENAVFVTDNDITELASQFELDTSNHEDRGDGRYYYPTTLTYSIHGANPPAWIHSDIIDLDDVTAVKPGCDDRVLRAIRSSKKINTDQCFGLVVATGGALVTVVCSDRNEQNAWVNLLNHFYGKRIEELKSKWIEGLYEKAGLEDGNISLDASLQVLNGVNRNTDKAYVKEMFGTFAKLSGSKKGETMGGDHFRSFFDFVTKRPEVHLIYERLLDKGSDQSVINVRRFSRFLTEDQRDDQSISTIKRWIQQSEPILISYNLTSFGFTSYLLSDEHIIFNRHHRSVYQDMNQPLCHYFIATSHNTYLTKDQLKGKSSVEAYISALKRGCKCVELDCWDGPNNEPIIYHGHTLTSKILFKDVIHAINEYAFHVSPYPVILSFENHCSVEQQTVMANYLTSIFQAKLYTQPPPDFETKLPSPEELKGYIIVKNKKLKAGMDEGDEIDDDFSDEEPDLDNLTIPNGKEDTISMKSEDTISFVDFETGDHKNGDINENETDINKENESPKEKERSKSTSSKKSFTDTFKKKDKKDKDKVPKISPVLSDLVAYCQATHFRNFEYSKEHAKHYEMSSFAEKKAMKLANGNHKEFIEYNRRQLSRIYPAGSRIDSSNYDPTPLWNVGVQLVALNYQTGSGPMQLNQGLFRDNGFCGYILKPEFLRQESSFDPKGSFDKPEAYLKVRVVSGSQLPYKSDSSVKKDRELYVQIRVNGVEADNHRERTKAIKNNGYNPTWNEDLNFKLHVPELAMVTFTAFEGTGTFLGQFALPFRSIMQGYRQVPLENKMSSPLTYSSLFVHIDMTS